MPSPDDEMRWYVHDGVFDAEGLHPAPGTRQERADARSLRSRTTITGTVTFTRVGYRRLFARNHPDARRMKTSYARRRRNR